MRYTVQRHAAATAFLARAEPWLLRAEAENNLVLAIARGLTASVGAYEPPIYLATVEAGRRSGRLRVANAAVTRPGMHQRIYRLDEVQPLADVPPGRLRPATGDDADLEWIAAFRAEADATGPGAREWTEERIRTGCARSRRTPGDGRPFATR